MFTIVRPRESSGEGEGEGWSTGCSCRTDGLLCHSRRRPTRISSNGRRVRALMAFPVALPAWFVPGRHPRRMLETNMRACKRAVGGVSPKPFLTMKLLTHTHNSRRWRMQPSEFVLPCKRTPRPAAGSGDAHPHFRALGVHSCTGQHTGVGVQPCLHTRARVDAQAMLMFCGWVGEGWEVKHKVL